MSKAKAKDEIGVWLDNAGRYPAMSAEQISIETARIQSLKEGDPRRAVLVNRVVERNLRLVVFSVKSYLAGGPSGRTWGCPETVDFLQVGTLGLIRAVELYDPARGYTFSTYANHWIRSKVGRYGVKTRGLVHVSETMARNVISYKKNGFLRSRKTGQKIPKEKILPTLMEAEAALSCRSLNFVDQFGHEIIDSIPDDRGQDDDADLPASLDAALAAAGVSPVGREVVMLIHGHGRSRAEVAERLGLTVNQVRRQSEVALRLARECPEVAALI